MEETTAPADQQHPGQKPFPIERVYLDSLRDATERLTATAEAVLTDDAPADADLEDLAEALEEFHEAEYAVRTAAYERLKRRPQAGARVYTDYSGIVAHHVRRLRSAAKLSQARLADAMAALGYSWTRNTVAEIEAWLADERDDQERKVRRVSLEEVVGLAVVFAVPVIELILPARDQHLWLAGGKGRALPPELLTALVVGIGQALRGPERVEWQPAFEVAEPLANEPDGDLRPAVHLAHVASSMPEAIESAAQAFGYERPGPGRSLVPWADPVDVELLHHRRGRPMPPAAPLSTQEETSP